VNERLARVLSRRRFLQTLGLGAAACAGIPGIPSAFGASRRHLFADLHIHPHLGGWIKDSPVGHTAPALAGLADSMMNRTSMNWKACHRAGIDALCVSHFNMFDEWLSMPTDPNPDAPRQTFRMMDRFEASLTGEYAPYARCARNYQELGALLAVPKDDPAFRIAVVHTLEGGHALGGSLLPLPEFAARGVAFITLTHFFNKGISPGTNSFPFFPDSNSPWPYSGLSPFGHDVVRAMEDAGMIVDISHAPASTVEDVLKISRRPMLASHSSVRTLGDHPYSLYDEQIQEVARRGGVVGIILMPYWLSNFTGSHLSETEGSLRDVVRTVRYVIKITGSHEHVGIGSDFGGYIPPLPDIHRLRDIGRLFALLEDEIGGDAAEAVMAGNVIRFLLENWRTGLPPGKRRP